MGKFWVGKRVLVTGGAGFLGTHVVKALKERGCTDIVVPRFGSGEILDDETTWDLRYREDCWEVVGWDINIVLHLAATVGGILFNQEHPAEMVYNNLVMGAHLMEEARLAGVQKFLTVGTACMYPESPPIPFREDDLWKGYPTEVTAPYGLAKRALLTLSQAYRKQYGFNAIFVIPTNLYGPGDHFDPEYGHVIPALVRKFVEAKRQGHKSVTVWGTGKATRDFLYVEDAAEGILLAVERYYGPEPVNLGSGRETPIRELVETIVEAVGYRGKVVWDATKPDGQPRRLLDTARAKAAFGFESRTTLLEGLRRTLEWYQEAEL